MILNLANQITLSRLLLAAVCLALLSQFSAVDPNATLMGWCAALFSLAALTDWLDGYVARKRGQVTPLGRILDPFVDKVLICGAFLVYSSSGFVDAERGNITGIQAWMVVVIIGSELLVSGLASFCESQGQRLQVTRTGKLKMVVQSISTGWVMLFVALGHAQGDGTVLSRVTLCMVWATVVITALSGLNYLYLARHAFVSEAGRS